MKALKIFLLFSLPFLSGGYSNAQFGYAFSTSSSGYSSIGGSGTDVFSTSNNNSITGNIAIGFNFTLGCVTYTQFQICTEGWIGLGGGMASNSTNNLNTTAQRPKIAPLWDNIAVSGSGSAGIRYELTGTAPNRVMSIEFRRMRWDETAGSGTDRQMSFIINLFETSNVIQFQYQQEGDPVSGTSASIGIAGPTSGQFISVSNAAASSTVTEFNVTNKPADNAIYTFTPNVFGCSGTPTAGSANSSVGSVTCGSPAVNFTVSGGSSGCGIAYQWQSSPDNTTWTNIAGAIGASHSQVVATTTYFRRVITCLAGGLSSNSNSVLVTYSGCTGTPVPGTLTASTTSTNCTSSTVNFTIAGGASGCDITYQWQYSDDNVNFTDLMGQTSSNMSASILATGYYRRVTTCAVNGISANSNAVLITNSGTGQPNDLPCYSIGLSLGVPSSGSNVCSNNSFEPSTPSCWTGGSVNTVWYSFVAPASGQVNIKTIITSTPSVLQRTQIALYSGTCSSLTQIACNEDAPSCGGYTQQNSQITASGLVEGNTYYISVDGENNFVGDFAILVISGNGNFPDVPGQDCPTSFSTCNPTTTTGNPGYQAIGGSCDHVTGNCTNGEANSIWYTINIGPVVVPGTRLTFDIVPNDYGNPNPITGAANPGYVNPGNESDYDFVLWKVSGVGATNCAGIAAGAAASACNYDFRGVTGCSTNGTSPYAGFDNAYATGPTVAANEVYLLVIQNWANSVSGFTLQFPTVSPVVYIPPTTVFWSGGAFNNSFTTTANWGGCNIPSCGVSAVVTPSSTNQPELPAGTYSVNNLTINPGAVLTIQSGATLQICGNFTNNGTLICAPGSTVTFIGTGTQTLSGAFENTDGFFNFTVNKLTGTVVLTSNIDVDGDFLTSNNTSILNTNGNRVRVGGNFTNANGNSTFTNTGTTGTLGFIGTGARSYTQGSSQLDLNFVIMNKTGAGTVTLNSNMFIKATSGDLTLTNGKIITGTNRVDVANGSPNAVNAGSVNSYVVGNLYRTLSGAAGSFDFPLGTSANYERANVTFTTTTTIPRLLTRFDPWAGAPNTIGLTECLGNYILPAQNMGLWTINASANPSSGTYNMTLYSTGATNTAGASGWTIQKAASTAGPWSFNGTCAFSSVSVIARTSMNGFSVFGVAQSTTPLPIELMDFNGYRYNEVNVLRWTTASEINSDYFLIEKSRNGYDFELLEKLNAQENSYKPIDYAATDEKPFNGITYYRLKFYDIDGTFEYSKTIAVSSEISKDLKISSVFPNPGKDELNMEYSVSSSTNLTLVMTDATGRQIKNLEVTIKGNGTYTIDTSNLAEGLYLFSISDNDSFKEVYNWVKK
jgi:hypothetical protein